jgi:hypothetical protein
MVEKRDASGWIRNGGNNSFEYPEQQNPVLGNSSSERFGERAMGIKSREDDQSLNFF